MANIRYISVEELKQLYNDPNLLICDIREPDEYKREHIIGARNTPLSTFDIDAINHIATGKILVLHCQSGNRTRINAQRFSQLACTEVLILCDGIISWKKQGCAVAKNNKAPLPLMRQVQIITGSLILLGVILSISINSNFIYLSALVGLGLLFAGITGVCGLASLLMLLPYNKNNGCNNSCS